MGGSSYRVGKYGGKGREPVAFEVLGRDASGKTTELIYNERTKTDAYRHAKRDGFVNTKLKDVRPAEKYVSSEQRRKK